MVRLSLAVAAASTVRLRFFNLEPASSATLQARSFVFDAGLVRSLPGGGPVALHVGNHWCHGTERFLRLEIVQPVQCRFQRNGSAEEAHGPFSRIEAVDALLIADGEPFALLRGREWTCLRTQVAWPRVQFLIPPP